MTLAAQKSSVSVLPCDGCGRASTPEHIAARIARLQWATRFRPIHIQVLFVALAPQASPEIVSRPDNLDGEGAAFPPSAVEDYSALLDGLGIAEPTATAGAESQAGSFLARLNEFQRRGFYLAFLAECPLQSDSTTATSGEALRKDAVELCTTYGPTLLKRIRYSYKPKQIALLSPALGALVPMLEQAGLGQTLLLDHGEPFELPRPGGLTAGDFQAAWDRALVARPVGSDAAGSL